MSLRSKLFFLLFLSIALRAMPLQAALTTAATTQTQLEEQLKEVEREIAEYEKQLTSTTNKKKTLTNAVAQLKIKQQQLQALLKQTSLKISSLDTNISVTQRDLEAAEARAALVRGQMAATIQSIHQEETRPLFILAQAETLSTAFTDIQHISRIASKLTDLSTELRRTKTEITDKKSLLEDQKEDAQQLLKVKSIQSQELAGSLREQNNLLTETKGLESNYQKALADSKKRAAEIRGRIYELFNTGTQVNFGQAVDIAKHASSLTGVRASFLLAILTQESNLGKNVGTCNRAGDPPEKSWKVVMKPTRDQEPFKTITKELGLDIDTTPVSCPMKNKDGSQLGWGGAMGPAQFIPSTWMGYKDKVSALTGKPANPWDIRDAFIAAGVKLGSQGAKSKEGEWKAAMLYFSGSTNLAYRFYGDNVVATAERYQKDIDALNE